MQWYLERVYPLIVARALAGVVEAIGCRMNGFSAGDGEISELAGPGMP